MIGHDGLADTERRADRLFGLGATAGRVADEEEHREHAAQHSRDHRGARRKAALLLAAFEPQLLDRYRLYDTGQLIAFRVVESRHASVRAGNFERRIVKLVYLPT